MLVHRLGCHQQDRDAGEDLKGAKKQLKLLARLKTFADATLTGAGGGAPLLALVRKLLASLAAVENLPVPAAPPSSLSAGYRYSSTYGFGAVNAITAGQLPRSRAVHDSLVNFLFRLLNQCWACLKSQCMARSWTFPAA